MATLNARGLQASTVKKYVFGVKFMWKMLLERDPTSAVSTPFMVLRAFQAQPKRASSAALPFTPSMIELHLHGLSDDPCISAAIIFGFVFFMRVGEYCGAPTKPGAVARTLLVSDVVLTPRHITATLRHWKNQNGAGPITLRRARCFTRWCPHSLYTAYAAQRVDQSPGAPAFQLRDGRPLSADTLNGVLREWARRSGVPEELVERHTSHGLRKGGCVASIAVGKPDSFRLRDGRWGSLAAMRPYLLVLPEIDCATTMQRILPNVFNEDSQ